MCCLCKRITIGVLALLQLHGKNVHIHGFVATCPRSKQLPTRVVAATKSLSKGMVAAASVAHSQPSWYEKALLDYTNEDELQSSCAKEMNDQLEILEEIELQELCAMMDHTFDIGLPTTNTKIRSIKPKKHKHLFRYSPDISVACWLATVTNLEMLESCGFTKDDIGRMTSEFPKLMKMDPKNMIAPKLRFLVNVLGGGSGDIGNGVSSSEDEDYDVPHNLRVSEQARRVLPAKAFFDSRLETAICPRHAYLALHGDTLPFGKELLDYCTTADSTGKVLLLDQFLDCCSKKPAEFARLCNQWQVENIANRPATTNNHVKMHTAETVMAMDNAFCDGLVPFARNEMTPDLQVLDCTSADMFKLLLDHGANYAEHDDWGATALMWAAGTGNLDSIKALVAKLEKDEEDMEGNASDVLWSTCSSCFVTKDQATPLHWAAAGANHAYFGCGGDVDVCRFLLNKAGDKAESLANSITAAGNTPFMWACWSGSLNVAKFLVKEGKANPTMCNEEGSTAAHWAASAGHVEVCRYLQELGLKFDGKGAENKAGKTPLDCAKLYEQADVLNWVAKQNLGP